MRQDSQQFSFHFSDISMPLRIAAVAILSVLAIVGVGSTARYAASLPKTTTNQSANTNTNTNQSNAPTNDQANPNIAQPQVNTGGGGSIVVRCNTTQRNAFTAQYNSQVAAENARHQNVINFLTSSGASAAAIAAENATHAANLASINAQYQNNLRSINC